jgi:hypothetical protein
MRLHFAWVEENAPNTIRWDPPFPSRACKPSSLENSKIEKMLALNQQVDKILLDLNVA